MYDYGEYCPISKAAQVLCERWTLLIVREMLDGVTRFNEFRKYLPRISPSLLNERLRLLEQHGLVVRHRIAGQKSCEYQLTPAGRELEETLLTLGRWATRWVYKGMSEHELNTDILMRDIQRALNTAELPNGRTVILFQLTDVRDSDKWTLISDNGVTELCDEARALDVDVYVTSDRHTLAEMYMNEVTSGTALANGRVKVMGTAALVRSFPAWFSRSPLVGDALKPRPHAAGR